MNTVGITIAACLLASLSHQASYASKKVTDIPLYKETEHWVSGFERSGEPGSAAGMVFAATENSEKDGFKIGFMTRACHRLLVSLFIPRHLPADKTDRREIHSVSARVEPFRIYEAEKAVMSLQKGRTERRIVLSFDDWEQFLSDLKRGLTARFEVVIEEDRRKLKSRFDLSGAEAAISRARRICKRKERG